MFSLPIWTAAALAALVLLTTRVASTELPATSTAPQATDAPPAPSWKLLGHIQPRPASQITASNWSVGAETMDRDYTIYEHWKPYLGPLGVKKARLQSGWAKTEKTPGRYDFAWLDAIVDDMRAQGVQPWICICYGNPIHEGGGSTDLGAGLPSGKGLDAWDKYVAALAEHFKDRVTEWEIWNEPNLGNAKNGLGLNTPAVYGEFLVRTAETLRAVQPQARILGFALAGGSPDYITPVLAMLKEKGKLHLVNEVTYHPYSSNPDDSYKAVVKDLQAAVAGFSKDIRLRQGENGCPSQQGGFGALSNLPWTEVSQAKWALRRLLGDLGRDIPSSYFAIADMCYLRAGKTLVNTKGLLLANPDKTIARPKAAYFAVQHLTSVFDDNLQRLPDFPAKPGDGLATFAYRNKNTGAQIVTIWEDAVVPGESIEKHPRTLTFPAAKFTDPVYVDLRTGGFWAIPAGQWQQTPAGAAFTDLPVYDSPILLAERKTLPAVKP